MNILKEEYSKGRQSINLTKIIESDEGLKIKIDIKSDSYDFQCFARVSTFNTSELKWNILSSIPYSNMKTPSKIYYSSEGKSLQSLASLFQEDILKLTLEAELILNQNFSLDLRKKKKIHP